MVMVVLMMKVVMLVAGLLKHRFQAALGLRRALPAFLGDAEFMPEVFQRMRAPSGCLLDLSLGDGFAYAHEHQRTPEFSGTA